MSSISTTELTFLEQSLGGVEIGYVAKLRITDIPIKAIVTNSCFWGLILSGFCCSVLDFVVFNMLPKYLSYVHNYSLESIGTSSAIIWGMVLVFVGSGTFTIDYIINKWFATRRTFARQLICIIMIMPSLIVCTCLAAMPNVMSGETVVCLLAIAQGCFTWCLMVRDPVMVDMAPKLAGTLYGVADLFYAANGFVVPLLSSAFVTDYSVAVQWRSVWLLVIVFNVLFVIIYTLLCKSEETDFSMKLEQKRRPSQWSNFSSDQIDWLERRMQQEHPHLKYNRRTSIVESIADDNDDDILGKFIIPWYVHKIILDNDVNVDGKSKDVK